ncbi:MAG: hypothetical protein P1U40_07865 [Coxiellaceae bacterium]|nr:hypothetical protein [Coxiellaceae bacterium]
MNNRSCILACALSLATLAAASAYANQTAFEVGVQASYYAMSSHGHSNHMFITLDNVNNDTGEAGCVNSDSVPMPIRAPRLRINASASRKLHFSEFHADNGGICLQPGSSSSYLIPGVTDQEPLQIPANLKNNQNLTYVFITFNDQHERLSVPGYQKANRKAQALCQKAINNARPKVVNGTCYAIPKYGTSRNAGYYAVITQLAS